MDVSIIYVNYKTSQLIIDSINSVKEKTFGINYEIIVVDNNSEDHSLSRIKEAHPEVLFIPSKENLGFGRANNLGVEIAKGDYMFFLNPDTLLINNAIRHLKDFLDQNPHYGVCGGNQYDENGLPAMSFGRRFPSFWEEFISIFYLSIPSFPHPRSKYFNYTCHVLNVAFISGADLMVRKRILDKVGPFSSAFFMNFEETELCHRISKNGYKIGSIPYAKITHLEGKSEYINQSRLSFYYEGHLAYFHKKNPIIGARLIYSIVQMKNNIRLLLFSIIGNKMKKSYWHLRRQTYRQTFASFRKRVSKRDQ